MLPENFHQGGNCCKIAYSSRDSGRSLVGWQRVVALPSGAVVNVGAGSSQASRRQKLLRPPQESSAAPRASLRSRFGRSRQFFPGPSFLSSFSLLSAKGFQREDSTCSIVWRSVTRGSRPNSKASPGAAVGRKCSPFPRLQFRWQRGVRIADEEVTIERPEHIGLKLHIGIGRAAELMYTAGLPHRIIQDNDRVEDTAP